MSIADLPPTAGFPPEIAEFAIPPFPVRRFTVDEYERLTKIGMLHEDDSVELLEGWIVKKMTKNPRHDATIDIICQLLWRLLPSGWFPRGQNVLLTEDSAPEPDVVVTRGRPQDFIDRHPVAGDVALVIEVSESSIRRDRAKSRIYARAGVALYWIVDLNTNCVEVFSNPDRTTGRYAQEQRLTSVEQASFTLPSDSIVTLNLVDILPSSSGRTT